MTSLKYDEIWEITKVSFITSYVKGQRIQWLGHAMRREETNEERQLNTSQQEEDQMVG